MIPLIIAVEIGAVGILNAVLFWFMPRLTRPDLYFAITVAPGFRDDPEAKSILRRYRTELTLLSALALTAVVVGVSRLGAGFVPGGFLVQLAALFIAFYRARQRVLPHAFPPTTIREAELHGRSRIIPGGWVVASGPFILLAAGAVYMRIHPEGLPARFTSVYLLSTAGTLAALTVMLYGISHWLRSVHAGGPEGARELKFRGTVSAILVVTEYFIALQASRVALAPLRHDLKPGSPGGIVISLLHLFWSRWWCSRVSDKAAAGCWQQMRYRQASLPCRWETVRKTITGSWASFTSTGMTRRWSLRSVSALDTHST